MNEVVALKFDKPGFFRWLQGQQHRHELVGGRVVMMTGGSKNHAKVIGSFVGAFVKRLDRKVWAVAPTDLAIEIGDDIRYPDVVVERQDDKGAELSTQTPVVLVEVLSPSSIDLDLEDKLAEYTSLPSLGCYIVASQDNPSVRVWQRGGEGRAFPSEPRIVEGIESVIEINALDIEIPLSEIY